MCQNQSNIPTLEFSFRFSTEQKKKEKAKKLMFFCFRFHFVCARIVRFVWCWCCYRKVNESESKVFDTNKSVFQCFLPMLGRKMVRNHQGNACKIQKKKEKKSFRAAKDKLLYIQIHFGSQHSISCMQNCHFKLQMESQKRSGKEREKKKVTLHFGWLRKMPLKSLSAHIQL